MEGLLTEAWKQAFCSSQHGCISALSYPHFRDTAPASPFLPTLQYSFMLVLLSFVFQRFITGKTIIWKVVFKNVLWSIKSIDLELGVKGLSVRHKDPGSDSSALI